MELDQYHKTAMIYGLYPEVYTTVWLESKQQLLKELVNSYLFKDVLALDGIKHSQVLVNLTKLLAYQIWQEVSINELAAQLWVSAETVNRYIYLLEQSFIIYSLRAYSKNWRKEISKKHKYYFYDLGIRNTLISNYDPIEVRADKWALWENFVINERIKRSSYHQHYHNRYFWRTYTGSEVDYIEEYGWWVHGYEFKYQSQKMTSSRAFYTAYPDATLQLINSSNYLRFITSFK
jgi:predicted AAA+ superfamily ATPase